MSVSENWITGFQCLVQNERDIEKLGPDFKLPARGILILLCFMYGAGDSWYGKNKRDGSFCYLNHSIEGQYQN